MPPACYLYLFLLLLQVETSLVLINTKEAVWPIVIRSLSAFDPLIVDVLPGH
jgi:hypothetical protein